MEDISMATQWSKETREEGWRLETREHQVEIWHNNQLFTVYKFYPDQLHENLLPLCNIHNHLIPYHLIMN